MTVLWFLPVGWALNAWDARHPVAVAYNTACATAAVCIFWGAQS